jgi:tetratricopeptide (TPR) repeat protein
MTTNPTPLGELLLAKLSINPSNLFADFPGKKLDQYIAVVNWLKKYKPKLDATNLDKVRGLLEAFHHLCEVEDWQRAKAVMGCQLDTPTQEELHQQLGTWGYYQEQSELYKSFLNNLGGLHPFYKIAFLHGQGNISYANGFYLKSIDYYQQALEVLQASPNSHQEGVILNNIGLAYLLLGKYDEAEDYFWQRLVIAWRNKELEQEGATLNNLGLVHHAKKEYHKAIKYQRRSLSILRLTGDKSGEGSAWDSLGTNYAALGDYSKAFEYQQQHLAITQELQDRRGEGEALCNMGITLILLKRYSESLEFLDSSIKVCRTIGVRSIEAYALKHLALLHLILGEGTLAFQYCDRALSIATELGIPLAKECQELKEQLFTKKHKL